MPRRSPKVLPLSEKLKVLNLIRKEKNCMLRLLRSMLRMHLLFMKLWRRKKSVLFFAITAQTSKAMDTVYDKCLVKMEKALDLYNKIFWEKQHSHNLLCVCAKSLQSCPTLCDPMDCSPPGSSVHGNCPGKNTGVGCYALLQGIFRTQGSNPHLLCLLHWQAGVYTIFFFLYMW